MLTTHANYKIAQLRSLLNRCFGKIISIFFYLTMHLHFVDAIFVSDAMTASN